MWCFVHFDLEMCFAPRWRALFRHGNFQKWSEHLVLCAFWLGNVLRATTACNFSSLIWPNGSAPAALTSLLFDPPFFAHLHLLSSLSSLLWSSHFFSSPPWLFPPLLFHLSILSEVWLLNLLRQQLFSQSRNTRFCWTSGTSMVLAHVVG